MKRFYLFLCFTCISSVYQNASAQCENGRYYNQIFSDNITTVQYGSAMEYDSVTVPLSVDIYQPSGDNLAKRPLMIFAFGGSFVSGARESPDLVTLCTYFSERGYVCASIDYRLGVPNGDMSDTNMFAAMIRGIQDMKGAVRYFYKDASTVNQFRIDTNQIFIGGVSAGAFIGLNYAYWNFGLFSKPIPGFAVPILESLGGIEGTSGNPGYSDNIKGVIDLSGAIVDTIWIQPGGPMLVGEHGTADSLVICWWDSAYAIQHVTSFLFGGGDIKNRLSDIVFNDSFYLFWGAGHCPFILPLNESVNAILEVPLYMDSTEWLIRDFLAPNIVCDTTGVSGIDDPLGNFAVSIFPNPSNDEITVYSHQSREFNVAITTVLGQVVQRRQISSNSAITLYKSDFNAGVYLLQFTDKATGRLQRTEKIVFY